MPQMKIRRAARAFGRIIHTIERYTEKTLNIRIASGRPAKNAFPCGFLLSGRRPTKPRFPAGEGNCKPGTTPPFVPPRKRGILVLSLPSSISGRDMIPMWGSDNLHARHRGRPPGSYSLQEHSNEYETCWMKPGKVKIELWRNNNQSQP